ncbi:hypothetical protein [Actinoallomurus sp. CA-142502]
MGRVQGLGHGLVSQAGRVALDHVRVLLFGVGVGERPSLGVV